MSEIFETATQAIKQLISEIKNSPNYEGSEGERSEEIYKLCLLQERLPSMTEKQIQEELTLHGYFI